MWNSAVSGGHHHPKQHQFQSMLDGQPLAATHPAVQDSFHRGFPDYWPDDGGIVRPHHHSSHLEAFESSLRAANTAYGDGSASLAGADYGEKSELEVSRIAHPWLEPFRNGYKSLLTTRRKTSGGGYPRYSGTKNTRITSSSKRQSSSSYPSQTPPSSEVFSPHHPQLHRPRHRQIHRDPSPAFYEAQRSSDRHHYRQENDVEVVQRRPINTRNKEDDARVRSHHGNRVEQDPRLRDGYILGHHTHSKRGDAEPRTGFDKSKLKAALRKAARKTAK